jgi:SSS family solute:Na+ symporter
MSAKVLYPGIESEQALPTLLTNVLPIGATGFVVAAFAAAVMSTASGLLIVATATSVRDIYQSFINRQATEKQIMKYSRLMTVAFGIGSLAIALYLPFVIKLLLYGYAFQAALFFPVMFGLFWKRANATAAFWSLLIAGLGSVCWAILDNPFGLDPIYFGMPTSLVLMLVLSYTTTHSGTERLDLFDGFSAVSSSTLSANAGPKGLEG